MLFKPLEVGDGNLFVELNGDLDWTKSNMDCVDPFLDLKEFEKDNVDVELLEDPDDDKLFVVLLDGDEVVWFFLKCSGESEFGKNGDFTDLTVTDVPEGIPLTLSRLESCILESLVILSTFVLFSSPFNSFLVMVVWPPRIKMKLCYLWRIWIITSFEQNCHFVKKNYHFWDNVASKFSIKFKIWTNIVKIFL